MGDIAKKYQDELPRIKRNISDAYSYWKENYKAYWDWSKFVYITTLNDDWKSYLTLTQTPDIEFNILEPFVNRQAGEFVKNEPNVTVSSENPEQANVIIEEVIEGFFRHQFSEANKSGIQRENYSNMLAKSFGVMKVWTDYKNDKSFDLDIFWDNVYDPTLCFFDPLAKKHHKNDGTFAGECYPFTLDDFKQKFPNASDNFNFGEVGDFNWCYSQLDKKIVLVCEYYERVKKRTKIVKIASGQVITYDEYKKIVSDIDTYGLPAAAPEIIAERYVQDDTICKYTLTQNEVLSYEETNYSSLPYVWFIGSSVKTKGEGSVKEVCRPLIYSAKGAQQMKNVAGQSLVSAILNQPKTKWIIATESIPAGQEDMYKTDNVPHCVLYNSVSSIDPTKPIAPPQLVQPTAINPELSNSFQIADRAAQASLGIYDAALGINDNQLSGAAIDAGATQSNAAVVPFNTAYMDSLNQVANIMLELMPKVWKDERLITVKTQDGKIANVPINSKTVNGSPDFSKIDVNNLNIKIEAGANFTLQKEKAIQIFTQASQTFPSFANFFQQTPETLKIIMDNLDFHGKDMMIKLADDYIQQQKVMMEQAKQNPQPSPQMMALQLKQQELQLKAQQNQNNLQLEAAKIGVNQSQVDNDRLLTLSKVHQATSAAELQQMKSHAEEARASADVVVELAKLEHQKRSDMIGHTINAADTLLKHQKQEDTATNNNINPDVPAE